MSTSSHYLNFTAGPWTATSGKVVDYEGTAIAYMDGGADGSPTANARLISSAPDMLEALQQWLDVITIASQTDTTMADKFPLNGSMLSMTRGAINKALGGD